MRKRLVSAILCAVTALVLLTGGCSSFTNPATGSKHLIAFGRDDELGWGKQVDAELSKKPGFSRDAAKKGRVERIGKKIVSESDAKEWEYKFEVLKTGTPNAFAAPGGYIYVTEGLLKMMGDSDDELASVLAHEAGHIAAKHTAVRMHRAVLLQGAVAVLATASGEQNAQSVAQIGMVVSSFILLSNGRGQEHEADRLGVKYAHKAGYNPEGMVTFFKKLEKMEAQQGGGGKMPNFMSTHPSTPDRIDRVKAEIRKVRAGGDRR